MRNHDRHVALVLLDVLYSDAVFTELGSAVERIRVEKSHMNFMYDLEEFEAIVNEEGVFEDEDPLQHSPIAEC